MKKLTQLSQVCGGFDDYDYVVTPENYYAMLGLMKMQLENSTIIEISQDAQPEWLYSPVFTEIRGDQDFELDDVDFKYTIGITLKKIGEEGL